MTFWACRKLYLRRISEINASLHKLGKPSKYLDTFVSANVMLDTSDDEHSQPPHRAATRTRWSRCSAATCSWCMDFADDVDLEEKHVELKIKELSEADMDSILESYRASQDELLGRLPLTPPSATARANNIDLCNASSIESDTSDSEDDEPEPEQGMLTATYTAIS